MNRIAITMLAVAVVMAGCAGNPGKGSGGGSGVVSGTGASVTSGTPAPAKRAKAECVFPDLPSEEAPLWVCDVPVEGVAVSAVGSQEKTAAGVSFQKDQALADARVKLAQQMQVRVTNMIKRYAETTGAAASETVDRVNTSVSKLLTAETLTGSRAWRSTTSSSGTLYVLVGLDPTATKQSAEQAVKSSMKNDGALWQQFKAKQAQDELAAEIANGAAGK